VFLAVKVPGSNLATASAHGKLYEFLGLGAWLPPGMAQYRGLVSKDSRGIKIPINTKKTRNRLVSYFFVLLLKRNLLRI
jgi:hypothetical protein